MSLDYDLTKVQDRDALYVTDGDGHRALDPVTHALVFSMGLLIGVWKLTPHTIDEVELRLQVLYAAGHGLLFVDRPEGSEPRPFMRAELERRLGLETNGSALTRAQFLARLGKILVDDATRKIEARRRKRAPPIPPDA